MEHRRKILFTIGIGILGLLPIFSYPEPTLTLSADEVAHRAQGPFEHITLQAKAALVYDTLTNEVLYAKNENAALPLASITKVMTAITAADSAPATTIVTINDDSLKKEGDSGLFGNERWMLKDLLTYTLVSSSNDGAAAVAMALGSQKENIALEESEQQFVSKMNTKAQEIGLTQSKFLNASGLDVNETTAGAYGSAHDVATLMSYAIKKYPSVISATRYPDLKISSLDFSHYTTNTDIIAQKIPGLIAGKTGYSDLAGGNLVVAFDAGIQHPIIVVALGSTYDGRFQDVENLVHATIQTIAHSE